MAPTLRIEAHGITDVGLKRQQNEDQVGCFPELGLFYVVDGMGGQGAGWYAAQLVFKAVRELFEQTAAPGEAPLPFKIDARKSYQENRLIAAAQLAHQRLSEQADPRATCRGMASTVAAVSLFDGRAQLAHVGDSRVYLLRGGALELRPRDHTLINDYLHLAGPLTPEEIAALPHNVLTRALGMEGSIEVDSRSLPLSPGDVLLLSTDGVHALVPERQIAALLLEHPSPATAAEKLIAAALRNGGEDNATCLVVRVTES